ncbi:triose-phosphate isomerase [Vavraia culicis subsp. floridensis]|uniref:Triosephosphate isomerase n=1 Tax=Vavraia culicis (isolate floridensis) TaxID=948595 RepID=L2GR79_VAVCU|nr:triose-phosphate isomerase [Vavraia culicis subsp. floridensis]ELA46166.1 triose-phosphate isomerase [Vavraia culicis subsp. floridensis]
MKFLRLQPWIDQEQINTKRVSNTLMKKLLGGNLKLCCSKQLLEHLSTLLDGEYNDVETLYAVPFPYLSLAREIFPSYVKISAQDCSEFVSGAYTGEVSADMLVDIGINNVIIGHSERRKLFDDEKSVCNKVMNAFKKGMSVLLCVGEDEKQRKENKTIPVIERQLKSVLECMVDHRISCIDVAYEPVWSIGTGNVPENEEIEEVIGFIRTEMMNYHVSGRVVYGGSVSSKNVENLCGIKCLDGFLVGKSSTTEEFAHIARLLHRK